MVLDTSAILAILQDEPERRQFNEAIEAAEARSLSTASFVECSMILESRHGADGVRDLDLLIAKAPLHAHAGISAYRTPYFPTIAHACGEREPTPPYL